MFSVKFHAAIRQAITDLHYLLSKGYKDTAFELVGNRYKLNKRQRKLLSRITVAQQSIVIRQEKSVSDKMIEGKRVEIDGFNLLILMESLLSGAFVFKCQDGCYRDISSVHGTYKRVVKTEEAIVLIGQALQQLKAKQVHWYLDSPVSNSGRLKTLLLSLAVEHDFPWSVELVFNPDKELAKSTDIVISSDGWILDECQQWFNLGALLVEEIPSDSILNLI